MFIKKITVIALLVGFLSSCASILPYRPHLIGIANNNTMVVEEKKFNALRSFYAVMLVKEIEPLPKTEPEVFKRMRPIVEGLVAKEHICPDGFFFLENSFNLYEGAKVSAKIGCY